MSEALTNTGIVYEAWVGIGNCTPLDIRDVFNTMGVANNYICVYGVLDNQPWGNKSVYVRADTPLDKLFKFVTNEIDSYLSSMSDHCVVEDKEIIDVDDGCSIEVSVIPIYTGDIEIQLHICELL